MARGTRPAVSALRLLAFAILANLACVHAVEREYFWNDVTEQSSWTAPEGVPVAFLDATTNKPYYLDPKSGETAWEFPGDWKQVESETHDRPYYHNAESGESTWEKPEVLGWRRAKVNDEEL